MPDGVRTTALQWQAQGRAAVVVQVLSHQGSVPRETGTRMLVAADAVAGTIGGGHLELKAIADARQMLRTGFTPSPFQGEGGGEGEMPAPPILRGSARISPSPQPSPSREREPFRRDGATLVQRIALGPSLGQCCGGALELGFTPLQHTKLAAWPEEAPLFTLQLYGAGHVGRAIVRLLSDIDCSVQWIDEREAEFPADPLPPHIQRVCVEPVEAEVAQAPPGAFYLVLTHSHDLDLAICRAILQRADFAWFGLIGSRTKRARFHSRLAAQGIGTDALARMVCPIGVPGIAGKQPELIAIAVVAQLLQQASL